jgi:hypothetical protein
MLMVIQKKCTELEKDPGESQGTIVKRRGNGVEIKRLLRRITEFGDFDSGKRDFQEAF